MASVILKCSPKDTAYEKRNSGENRNWVGPGQIRNKCQERNKHNNYGGGILRDIKLTENELWKATELLETSTHFT